MTESQMAPILDLIKQRGGEIKADIQFIAQEIKENALQAARIIAWMLDEGHLLSKQSGGNVYLRISRRKRKA